MAAALALLVAGAAGTALAGGPAGGDAPLPRRSAAPGGAADTVPLFGPRRFEAGVGRPALHVERFDSPAPENGGFILRVVDGDGQGNGRVTALSLRVNGAEVATAAALGRAGGTLDVPVALLGRNTLELSVEGPAGSGISVAVLQVPERSFTVFGPRTVTRAAGAPVAVAEQFTLPAGAAPPYRLHVRNGAAEGGARAASAVIRVNGVQVAGPSDLSRNVGALLRDVALGARNTVEVEVRGQPGAQLTWRITAMDTAAPVLAIAAPAPDAVTREAQVEVSGTVQDATPASVTVNGVDATRTGAGFRATVPLAAEGTNTLTVSAVDAAGNRTDSVRTVIRDTQAPELAILSPAEGGQARDSVIEVRGTVRDRSAVTANVNGIAVTLDGTGAFTVRIPAADGSNFITLAATDAAGNAASLVRQVIRDTQPPVLAVTSPAEGLTTNAASVTVTGTAADAGAVTVKVNGVDAAVDASGGFRAEVPLPADGPVTLHVEAADAAGNTAVAERRVTRDTQAPVLSLASPAEDLVTRESAVPVSGRVEDATAVALTLGGAPVAVAEDGSFTASAPLAADGPAALALVAVDAAGNRAELVRTVIRDTQAPALVLATPADGVVTRDGQVSVEGSVTDATVVALTVNGAPAAVGADGAFRVDAALVEGDNAVEVRATDAAGNETSAARRVVRDSEAPAIEVAAPAEGAVAGSPSATVRGRVRDTGPVQLTVNGTAVALDAEGAFQADVPLSAEGPNPIVLRAVDRAGNEAQASRTVVLDTRAPVLSALAPADGLVVRDEAGVVTGRVEDATTVSVRVNGAPVPVAADGSFQASVALAEGETSVVVTLTDAAGNEASAVVRIVRDSQAPVITLASPAEGTTEADHVTVSGTVRDATAVTLTLNGAPVALGADGAFSLEAPLATGANAFAFQATDAAGNTATVTRTVTREEEDDTGLPPDPSRVASPIDPTVATHLGRAAAFLYTGATPIQTGVAPGTIVEHRAAVLRGRVLTRAGAPLAGVRVSVRGHPEYGQTLSRRDGAYDLVVNGGDAATLDYHKDGYLPAQRTTGTAWLEFAGLDDVALVALDPRVTGIALGAGTAEAQVARGSVVSDGDGPRQATVLFAPGTEAFLELPDGTTRPMPSLSIRLTEYTVGPGGPAAMPGALPGTSGYTYAVELSADEAIAAGAEHARFSKPVRFYVENFLGFPVGGTVPVAYYERGRAAWVPMDNGRVIRVLAGGGALASVDANGDGAADGDAALAALGIDATERAELARTYPDGAALWRMQTTHFSPFDLNWATGPYPRSRRGPRFRGRPPPEECSGRRAGSVIECESRVLGERITVAGTDLTLNYRSDRVLGRGNETVIPVTGDSIDALLGARVDVWVAGRHFHREFAPAPNLGWTFRWDGLDAYGRRPQGAQQVRVRRTYTYPNRYLLPAAEARAFGLTCDPPGAGGLAACIVPTTMNERARQETTQTDEYSFEVTQWDGRQGNVAGWSLSEHHVYDPSSRRLYMGTGERRTASRMGAAIETIGGSGSGSYTGQNGQALGVSLDGAGPIAVAADGTVYVAGWESFWIARITRDGRVEHVAGGTSSARCTVAPCGDGGPLSGVRFRYGIEDLKFGPDGSLYIVDGRLIRKMAPDGTTSLVAGNWAMNLNDTYVHADGGPAVTTPIGYSWGVDVGPDGSVYFVESGNRVPVTRVRKVSPDGVIHTVAGGTAYPRNETAPCRAEGIAARAACLDFATDVDVAPDGTVYVLEPYNRLARVTPQGTLQRVAGRADRSCWGTEDGLTGLETGLCGWRMELHRDGRIFFDDGEGPSFYTDSVNFTGRIDGRNRMRVLGLDGIVTTAFGGNGLCGSSGFAQCGDGGLARGARIGSIPGLAFGPDGAMYLGDLDTDRVRRVGLPFPGYDESTTLIASNDGNEVYELDGAGRHVRTRDARTGAVRRAFGYDAAGRIASVTDGDGGVTRVERDGAGRVQALVAPGGERTALAENADGYLAAIGNPAGETVRMDYRGAGGLLSGVTDPRQGLHRFAYDDLGRLDRDTDPAGGFQAAAGFADRDCTAAGVCAEGAGTRVSTALGRTTTYWSQRLERGAMLREVASPTGLVSRITSDDFGWNVLRAPDGMTSSSLLAHDPRFGMDAAYARRGEIRTPDGLRLSTTGARRVVRASAADPFSITTQVDSLVVNGRALVTTYEAAARRTTVVTPAGRRTVVVNDLLGRPVEFRDAGALPVHLQPDPAGTLRELRHGGRVWSFDYDAAGRLRSVAHPLGSTTFSYDAVGRVTGSVLAGGRAVGYAYDAHGNRTGIRPPGRGMHTFAYDSAGWLSAYAPPVVDGVSGETRYRYDADGQVQRVLRPEGDEVAYDHDAEGRTEEVRFSGARVRYGYHPTTGQLLSAASDARGSLAYTWDGALPLSTTWSGAVSGTVSQAFDNDLRVASQRVNGGHAVDFRYDADGLLTGVGALTLTRAPDSGRLTGSTAGGVSTSTAYDSLGNVAEIASRYGAQTLFLARYRRDPAGRVERLTEAAGADSTVYTFGYDAAGRLATVHRDGVAQAAYEYDDNGNRLLSVGAAGPLDAEYDGQDRLRRLGDTRFGYTAGGDLAWRAAGADTTRYVYDAFGNLTEATLPDGTRVEYLVDPSNRRIGRRVGGALVQGFLYGHGLSPVAELDGTGQVVSRFVYGSRPNAPDLMVRGGVTYRLVMDDRGSVRQVVNTATGEVVQRLEYDAWGQVTLDTRPGFQPFGFAGGLTDGQVGLVRFGARDYDPRAGRWTTRDPARFNGRDTNLYGYALGDPVNNVDPNGELPILAVIPWVYGAIEAGLTVADVVDAVQTLQDPCTTGMERTGSVLGTGAGIFLPGAGYGRAARAAMRRHHVYPQRFREQFDDLFGRGAIDRPENIREISEDLHKAIHSGPRGGEWNADWEAFLQGNPSAAEARAFAQMMIRKYGLDD